jgi:hypothetical protein
MMIWIIVVGTAVAGASRPATRYEATGSNLVNRTLVDGSSRSPLLPTLETLVFETTTQDPVRAAPSDSSPKRQTSCLDTKSPSPHVTAKDIANATYATGTSPTNEDPEHSPAAAEPDVSLQIVFSVLGTLLTSASVIVAIFFGCRQPGGNRSQPGIAHHETPHGPPNSDSGVDLEMGPVPVPRDPAPLGAQPHVADQITTHARGTRFAYFFEKLKSMCAAPSPSSGREGQSSSATPLYQIQAPINQNAAAPMETPHEQQGGDATR